MSSKPYECTCDAHFITREALEIHLEEIQSQAKYHHAQLEKCKNHSRASDEDIVCNRNAFSVICPETGCTKPFHGRSKLRRHYQTHVYCDEICPECKKRFSAAGEFIRHTETNHKELTGRIRVFLDATALELKTCVDEELEHVEHVKSLAEGVCKKRPREEGGSDADIVGPHKRNKSNSMVVGDLQQSNGTDLPFPAMQPVTSFMPVFNNEGPQVSTMGSLDGLVYNDRVPSEDCYYAPILGIVNCPEFDNYELHF